MVQLIKKLCLVDDQKEWADLWQAECDAMGVEFVWYQDWLELEQSTGTEDATVFLLDFHFGRHDSKSIGLCDFVRSKWKAPIGLYSVLSEEEIDTSGMDYDFCWPKDEISVEMLTQKVHGIGS